MENNDMQPIVPNQIDGNIRLAKTVMLVELNFM